VHDGLYFIYFPADDGNFRIRACLACCPQKSFQVVFYIDGNDKKILDGLIPVLYPYRPVKGGFPQKLGKGLASTLFIYFPQAGIVLCGQDHGHLFAPWFLFLGHLVSVYMLM